MARFSLLSVFLSLIPPICVAQNYYCPQQIICSGIKVTTCQPGAWSNSWKPILGSHPYNILNPYFSNYAARFDPVPKIDYCFYKNPNGKTIEMTHLGAPIFPVFDPGTAWKWADPIHSNADCIGTGSTCPFTDEATHFVDNLKAEPHL